MTTWPHTWRSVGRLVMPNNDGEIFLLAYIANLWINFQGKMFLCKHLFTKQIWSIKLVKIQQMWCYLAHTQLFPEVQIADTEIEIAVWKIFLYNNCIQVIFKLLSIIGGQVISCETVVRWMSLDLSGDKATLVQVMAWCHQTTSHYLANVDPDLCRHMASLNRHESGTLLIRLVLIVAVGWVRIISFHLNLLPL